MNFFRKYFLICGVLAALLISTGHSSLFAEDSKDGFHLGGALRYNIRYTDYDDDLSYPNNFNFTFDTFRIDVKGEKNGVLLDLQYRFYAYNNEIGADDGTSKTGFYTTLHHGWFGYKTGKSGQVELGVTQVPFGNLTYNSHNYYFSTLYYVGLEDDYDSGIKYHAKYGALSVALAYFMESETGMGDVTNRYSYDVTPNSDAGYSLNEKNQGNLRLAYTLGGVELGASGQYGKLYNSALDKWGSVYAAAGHCNGTLGPVNLKLQYTYFNHDAKKDDGTDAEMVKMSAYAFDYNVAAKGQVYTAGISYSLNVEIGPVSNITFYNDYSFMKKSESSFEDTQQNTAGFAVTAGGIYAYFDYTMAKNHPWVGANTWTNGLAAGDPDAKWESNFNINLAYYF